MAVLRFGGATEPFPRGCYFLFDQLNRVALSVATNLAEGNRRVTKADLGFSDDLFR